jgi:hypothetical protein
VRIISFSLTSDQLLGGTKTVIRRLGWERLQPGTVLMAARKSRGLKPGEPIERFWPIRVVSVRREQLDAIEPDDVTREGFPDMSPAEFVAMFCRAFRWGTGNEVTRIEFERVPGS